MAPKIKTKKQLTAKGWILKYGKKLKKRVAFKKCIGELGISESSFRKAWNIIEDESTKPKAMDWLLENGKGLGKQEALNRCIEEIGVSACSFRRAWNKLHTEEQPVMSKKYAGLKGFAELHDTDIRIKRKEEHCRNLIDKFIAGPLLERGWFYDAEAAAVAGLSCNDLARYRSFYEHLIVKVSTDRGKKLTWVHPTLVKRAREIAERS